MKNYKIAVAGTGYVGLSLSVLLAQHNQVMAVDIVQAKVDMINNHKSPIQDDYIEKYLAEKELNLTATLDAKAAYSDADFVVIAAPTNYDSKTQHFDTSAVEAVIKLVMEYNPNAIMVIKSTIPVGYTASVRKKFNTKNIIFSPEFLRESKALYDNLYNHSQKLLSFRYNIDTNRVEARFTDGSAVANRMPNCLRTSSTRYFTVGLTRRIECHRFFMATAENHCNVFCVTNWSSE